MSDPFEKAQVVVQLPSSERLKPSYIHRSIPDRTHVCEVSAASKASLFVPLQFWNERKLFCVCGAAREDQPAQVPVGLEHPRSHLHGLL